MLQVAAERMHDTNFQCKTVLTLTKNGFYEKFHSSITLLLKNCWPIDPHKCEAVFSCLSIEDRNMILPDVQHQIPGLFFAWTEEEIPNGLSQRLMREIENGKLGRGLDFSLILSIRENDIPNLLLAMRAIRDCQTFSDICIPFLIKNTQHTKVTVIGSASVALMAVTQQNPKAAALIASSFVPTTSALRAFAYSLRFAELGDAEDSLNEIRNSLKKAIQSLDTKYAVLGVLASAVVHCGEQYRSFAGELCSVNSALLARMIEVERTEIAG
jgi:hypothetical protein